MAIETIDWEREQLKADLKKLSDTDMSVLSHVFMDRNDVRKYKKSGFMTHVEAENLLTDDLIDNMFAEIEFRKVRGFTAHKQVAEKLLRIMQAMIALHKADEVCTGGNGTRAGVAEVLSGPGLFNLSE